MAARARRSAEGVTRGGPGRPSPRDQQLGAAAAAHQRACRYFQGVSLAAGIGRLERLGQGAGNGLLAAGAVTDAHHISVDGVGQADHDLAAVVCRW